MSYRVVPFNPNISNLESGAATASKLEQLINSEKADGWEFVDVKQIDGYKAGSSGCFGFGAQPGEPITVSFVVFKK